MSSIVVKVDLRHLFGRARDQGQRPTCLAFATSDLHAALRGAWAPLSCEYAFYQAQRRAGRPPSMGATLPAMLAAIELDGQPHEAKWPYLSRVPTELANWRPPADVSPLFRRAGEPGSDNIDAVIMELNQGRPVLMMLYLSRSFYSVSADGIVDEASAEQPDYRRRHALIAVGYGDVGAQRAVLIRNSWGKSWGAQGYGWLTERYLLQRIFRLAMLKEDLSVSTDTATA